MNSELATLRSLVILAVLVGLPVLAIMPQGVQGALRNLWPGLSDAESSKKPMPRPNLVASQSQASIEPNSAGRYVQQTVDAGHPVAQVSHAEPILNSVVGTAPIERISLTGSADAERGKPLPLEESLRKLGASYFRLESWGDQPRVYRFHCTVTIQIGMAEYSRRFEATAEDPTAAMRQVENAVKTWHTHFPSVQPTVTPSNL